MTIDQAFNNTVAYYDDWMMKALPSYHKVFSISKKVIPFDNDIRIDVLDLGAGTGLFSKHVWEKYPNARFVLYDVAGQMLPHVVARKPRGQVAATHGARAQVFHADNGQARHLEATPACASLVVQH